MSDGTEGRQILPIPHTPYEGDVPLDAREASFPPIEPVRPPAGAPNVLVVLLDDVTLRQGDIGKLLASLPNCRLILSSTRPLLGRHGTSVTLAGLPDPAAARLVADDLGRQLTPDEAAGVRDLAEAVQGRLTILLDGGVRRGTDVVKALALGARAVLIGRPYLWGLAVDGAAGVQRVIEILRAELEAAMALCGAPSLGRISRQLVWPER